MIDRLVARILPLDPNFALQLELDARSGILSLSRVGETQDELPYGLDLSARVLLDFDSEWRLARLDLLIPATRWQQGDFAAPAIEGQGTLALNAMPTKRISCPLPVTTLAARHGLLLRWGPLEASSCVQLAPQVCALLAGSLWTGLYLQGV
ncbi:MAG: hypothetical protein CVV27_20900 [Candidatus Melainabacteria bacterium HGW-Melainabacteria-1]|nr:MAG: hypothetical protein CVV27_20900 [Candidatus Melainabacteria bacterium HGW-Melainabacteria-1]